ncbi:MAG: hypothetical protein GWN18_18185, partial [Thermoplasmata archaeon]|nr:hypothetical protein [Thermoplasmata archaeon]NIS14051.1 hypothetical protein [Thermoplasmata archaeon]NIS21885.1 hypothetical protein [Thermoplasmata archaeon]NIT79490.1 hypothetical protein [Thermoplasmata archaeon]NIU50920.1 hypothetical protein [Thermoplasmata archaeon]
MESVTSIALEGGPVYEFPKRFAQRKRISYVVLPGLFYGSLLVGLVISGPEVWGNAQLVLYMFLFLTAVMGFFMLLVLSSKPWILVFRDRVRVGRWEFPIDRLRAVIVYVDRRLMFDRPPYQLIFVVQDPEGGQMRFTSEAIRNVQDLDTLVRDLRELLPGVEFLDRTLSGGSAVS